MRRWKVFYGTGKHDYAVCYADDEAGARAEFEARNNNPILRVELFLDLRELWRQSDSDDEHEFLVAIMEAAEDLGVETQIVNHLRQHGWGR